MAIFDSLEQPYPSLAFKEKGETPIALIEITSDGTNRRLEVTEELIETYIETDYGRKQDSFSNLNAAPIPNYESIKFFWSRRDGEYTGDLAPIPMSRELYTRLAPWARVPLLYSQLLINKTAMCMMTYPTLPDIRDYHAPAAQIRDEYLSFAFQSVPGAMNHVCIGASFTYHFPTKHMYVFMHGLASVNYDRFARVIQNGAADHTAFLIPSLVIHFNLEQRVKALNGWQEEIYWHERKLGIRHDFHDNPDLDSIDFTKLSKDLNAANTNLAYVDWICKTTVRQLDFLDGIAENYRDMAVKNGHAAEEADNVQRLLRETHAQLRAWNLGLQDRADYLSKRGQALVQTVYSGIAQRDSAINLRLATTSQEVAVATSQDSAVMRVIAAITIFFLPATFTATFFSTTFFSFNGNLNGKVYSAWLWLYFVVTAVLTALVVVGTWKLWKNKEKDISRKLPEKRP